MVLCKYFQQGYCRYGSSCRFEHAYSSKYSYRAPQATENQNTASSLFRGAVQSNNNQSVFAPNRGSVFSRLGTQTNTFVSNESHKAKSLFAQATQNTFGQTQTHVPNTQNPVSSNAKSVFAQAHRSTFGEVQNQNITPQHNASNIFATAARSVFSQQNNSQFSNPSNVFQSSQKPANIFSIGNSSFDQTMCDENMYSLLEDLSKSDIEAFECSEFKLGCIPELPPPKTLCV